VSTLIQFADVSFTYGLRPVLKDVSFALPAQGLMALAGPNGAGKSTLLRLAAGLLPATGGSVQIEGRPLADWRRRELARTIALVPQHLDIAFPFTVEQIVAQGRTPYQGWFGGTSDHDRAAVERAMRLTGVAHVRTRTMNEISGGEQQRVKLAIALAQEPALLLLDEPLQNLDIGRQTEVLHLLLDLHEKGLTLVAAMHDLPAVRAHFPLTLLLTEGLDHMFGPTEKVLTPERVNVVFNLEAYGGGPANSAAASHPHGTAWSRHRSRPAAKRWRKP
jgi:iron complex transport system ATP-binding protein